MSNVVHARVRKCPSIPVSAGSKERLAFPGSGWDLYGKYRVSTNGSSFSICYASSLCLTGNADRLPILQDERRLPSDSALPSVDTFAPAAGAVPIFALCAGPGN